MVVFEKYTLGDAWVAQWLSVCLRLVRDPRLGIGSRIGLPAWSLLLPLPVSASLLSLSLSLSLSVCLS